MPTLSPEAKSDLASTKANLVSAKASTQVELLEREQSLANHITQSDRTKEDFELQIAQKKARIEAIQAQITSIESLIGA